MDTALLAPLFVTSAIVSGLALVILTAFASSRLLRLPVADDTLRALGRVLAWLIPVLGYLMFSELLTATYAGSAAARRASWPSPPPSSSSACGWSASCSSSRPS